MKEGKGRKKRKYSTGLLCVEAALVLLACFMVFPMVLIFINSYKANGEILLDMLALPEKWSFGNYREAISKMNFFRKFANTILVSKIGRAHV